jgi:hypothetical protein
MSALTRPSLGGRERARPTSVPRAPPSSVMIMFALMFRALKSATPSAESLGDGGMSPAGDQRWSDPAAVLVVGSDHPCPPATNTRPFDPRDDVADRRERCDRPIEAFTISVERMRSPAIRSSDAEAVPRVGVGTVGTAAAVGDADDGNRRAHDGADSTTTGGRIRCERLINPRLRCATRSNSTKSSVPDDFPQLPHGSDRWGGR